MAPKRFLQSVVLFSIADPTTHTSNEKNIENKNPFNKY